MQGVPSSFYNYNQQSGIITLSNGSEVILKDLFLYPSDPNFDSLGSLEITGAFVDECVQIVEKAWNVLKSRIRYKLDEHGLVPKILGTCNPSKGWVYRRYYSPFRRNELPEHANFIQSLLNDNPYISKHYRENLLTMDKASIQRLLHGNWEYDDDESVLCNYDAITSIFTNSHVEKYAGARYITLDVALQGSDRFVIGVWDGFALIYFLAIKKIDSKELIETIEKVMFEYDVPEYRMCYDYDGVGSYLDGFFPSAQRFMNGSPPKKGNVQGSESERFKERFKNLKSQCYFRLADAINSGKLWIKCDIDKEKDSCIEELENMRNHSYGTDKPLEITPKDVMKELIGRSPDISDMLMMRFFFTLENTLSHLDDIDFYNS